MTNYINITIPEIYGGGGGKGGGKTAPNSLFSTDILFLTNAFGEGPVYRINPNGPQDIQVNDGSIDDLLDLNVADGIGKIDERKFSTAVAYGTTIQDPLPYFGDRVVTPQSYSGNITLKKGNQAANGIPEVKIDSQQTSANDWDSIRFNFLISRLYKATSSGSVSENSIQLRISIFDRVKANPAFAVQTPIFSGKTDTPYKVTVEIPIPVANLSASGYVFDIEKISDESSDSNITDDIAIIGWDEVKETKLSYPRTALIGYAVKATPEFSGGVPNFTSLLKGLIVKVPSNYNQPILDNGEIDWRQLEVPETGTISINGVSTNIGYTQQGYKLQQSGTGSVLTSANPTLYTGVWDGTFVYSWTQNPVWIIYDILTNSTYGLGIPEENVDKYKFYQVAQYCDACDSVTGAFIGVDGVADGSFRYKPRGLYTRTRENQRGLPNGTRIKERRFILDVSVSDQEKAIDLLNKLASTIRAVLVYAGGKVTLAIDMPEEYPVMLFTEASIKKGSFQISGISESDIRTGVDVSYVEPTNHFKREVVRIDTADANDGTATSDIENILSLDLAGVTRRSQAIRTAQYQIAASRYLRRNVSFITSTDALNLAPGDVISVASQGTGIAYGFGGKVYANSAVASSTNTNVFLEHFTVPSLSNSTFTSNSNPLALRVIRADSDRLDLYLISNSAYSLSSTDNVSSGFDQATVQAISLFNTYTKSFTALSNGFTANIAPKAGDLWSIGEIENPGNYYTNKSGKLFKVTSLSRDEKTSEVTVSGVEYISNVYTDSDTFINYEPVSYTDITSPLVPPPTPEFSIRAVPRRKLDGTVVIDGIIDQTTSIEGYEQKIETEYYISKPDGAPYVANVVSTSPLTFKVSDISPVSNGDFAVLSGKSGFTTPAGQIRLLCNAISVGAGVLDLTLEGLSSCYDENRSEHILSSLPSGGQYITVPVREKTSTGGLLNFVGYNTDVVSLSRPVVSFSTTTNTVRISNPSVSGVSLANKLPATPFYVLISQTLTANNYSANSYYVDGTSFTYIKEGNLSAGLNTIELDVKPRSVSFVRFFVDGIADATRTVNRNLALGVNANIQYTSVSSSQYRAEVDYYTVPTIEMGDNLQLTYDTTFSVSNTSYDPSSATYNAALTSNSVYRIYLASTPTVNLNGRNLININPNPEGITNNVNAGGSGTFTLDYSVDAYPGIFNLSNNKVYRVASGGPFSKAFLTNDLTIPELEEGITFVRARNRNTLGRLSTFSEKSVEVRPIPIQRVENLTLFESLYREQMGGVFTRFTVIFDHIQNQEVTDYEISYKTSFAENIGSSDDGGTELINFNTVKVPATGVDIDNKIRFTINGINRGSVTDDNTLEVRVTPLNKSLRGVTTTITSAIRGKLTPPLNITGFTGGQQVEILTLFWDYARQADGQLVDLDLKEIQIRRIPGTLAVSAYNVSNFNGAELLVTVSAGSGRKSIPIDNYGTYTYLARTLDTSGNFSDSVVGVTLTTSRPQRSNVIKAYNEDDPTLDFAGITNSNSTETNYAPVNDTSNGGFFEAGASASDNANASSSGWSTTGDPDDLLAGGNAEYITPIRDVGNVVIGTLSIDIEGTQSAKTDYFSQKSNYFNSTSTVSPGTNVLVAVNVGHVLGFANAQQTTGRYDANNRTWMTGGANGNVFAIWEYGKFAGDSANSNSYALIAGIINANAIALGATYFANGDPTGSNSLANITVSGNAFTVVNLIQYNDVSSTFEGEGRAVLTQTFIRTSTANVFYDYSITGNANVNTLAFSGGAVNDGWVPYEAGTRTFRWFQIKFIVTNTNEDEYDFTLDKFRYTVDKEQTIYSNTVVYDTSPKVVDYTSANFLFRPVITYTILDQVDAEANPAIVVTTSANNLSTSFKLFASGGTGEYQANSTANIMITAIGV